MCDLTGKETAFNVASKLGQAYHLYSYLPTYTLRWRCTVVLFDSARKVLLVSQSEHRTADTPPAKMKTKQPQARDCLLCKNLHNIKALS